MDEKDLEEYHNLGKAVKGKFIRYLAENNVQSLDDFKGFEYDGFHWDKDHFVKEIIE